MNHKTYLNNLLTKIGLKHRKMKESGLTRSKEVEFRVAKTLFIMISVFTGSTIPHIASSFIFYYDATMNMNDPEAFDLRKYRHLKSFRYVASIVLMYNSLWNFFIYQQRDGSFRNSLKVLRRRVFGKRKISEPSPNRTVG